MALAACAAAARRCPGSPALRSFWTLMSVAVACEAIADTLRLANDIRYAQPPFPSAADAQRLRALGAAGVIAKPFDPMTLPADLERLLSAGA